MLPIELRERIVIIPWIKHLNLYVCKEWHNFIYNNLPDVDLEWYIRARDYFAIKYITLNFRYKLRELDNIRAAIEVNDSVILNMIINELYLPTQGRVHANIVSGRIMILENISNNYSSLKCYFKKCKSNKVMLDIYNKKTDEMSVANLKCLNLILENTEYFSIIRSKIDTSLLIATLSSSFESFYYRHIECFESSNMDDIINAGQYVLAYLECIRHGFYHIIKNIHRLDELFKLRCWNKLYFSLALSGTSKIKYIIKYQNEYENFTNLLIKSMNLQERYDKILQKMNT